MFSFLIQCPKLYALDSAAVSAQGFREVAHRVLLRAVQVRRQDRQPREAALRSGPAVLQIVLDSRNITGDHSSAKFYDTRNRTKIIDTMSA